MDVIHFLLSAQRQENLIIFFHPFGCFFCMNSCLVYYMVNKTYSLFK